MTTPTVTEIRGHGSRMYHVQAFASDGGCDSMTVLADTPGRAQSTLMAYTDMDLSGHPLVTYETREVSSVVC